MRFLAFCLVVASLVGCSQQAQDDIAREAARNAVAPELERRFPGIPLQPSVDCVIDNANAQQIRRLALDGVTGPSESTVTIVTDIVSKPETLKCLAAEGLPALLR